MNDKSDALTNDAAQAATRLGGCDNLVALAFGTQGNGYVTSSSLGDGTGYDFGTVKYVRGRPLTSALVSPVGEFRFTLLGDAGRSYTIQASSDFANWTRFTNFVSASGTNQFTDVTAINFNLRVHRAASP